MSRPKGAKNKKPREKGIEKVILPVDMVNHPPHYTFGKFEVIDVLEDWFKTDPLLWQTVKYLARAGRKNDLIEDLKKAEFYLKRRIQNAQR